MYTVTVVVLRMGAVEEFNVIVVLIADEVSRKIIDMKHVKKKSAIG